MSICRNNQKIVKFYRNVDIIPNSLNIDVIGIKFKFLLFLPFHRFDDKDGRLRHGFFKLYFKLFRINLA